MRRYLEEILPHADGVAVVADSIPDKQKILNQWHHEVSQKGMKIIISKEKTELIPISRNSEEYDVYNGRDKLNQEEEYDYVGMKLHSKNSQEIEIDNGIMKYNNNVRPTYP